MTVAPVPSSDRMAGRTGVRLEKVTRRYGDHHAVADLDLDVQPGEPMAVLGPSGAGKSTVLGLIAGFVEPSDGRVIVGGADVTHLPAHRRDIGVVFQNYALFPHLDVLRNVMFPLKARRWPTERARAQALEALDVVGLASQSARRPATLSGGQQQRVALARALVFAPSVLLLDEPLAALDLQLREQMRSEIRALQHRLGTTTLLVTHDQDEALTLADRILLLVNGRPEQLGTPRDLYERPRTYRAAEFLGAGTLLPAVVEPGGRTARLEVGAVLDIGDPQPPGTRGWVLLRPESLGTRHPNSDPAQGVDAVVDDVVYRGATATVSSRAADGTLLLSLVAPNASLRPGDAVRVAPTTSTSWFVPRANDPADPASPPLKETA